MTPASLLRSRLALRIYLTGLAQIAVVAAGFYVILVLNRPERRPPMHERVQLIEERTRALAGDQEGLTRELDLLQQELNADVAVAGPDDADYASSSGAASLRCPHPGPPHGHPAHRRRHRIGRGPRSWAHPSQAPLQAPLPLPLQSPPSPTELRAGDGERPPWGMCAVVPFPLPTGEGTLHVLGKPPPSPPSLAPRVVPLVLLVVGISSLLLAWSLVRPLQRMSSAAHAWGSGDLTARVGLRSRDELGEVARAFDGMAERLNVLLRAEKELLANVSHELRTPLARIRVALDLANEGDASMAREALTDIADDLDELERLLADVLTAARLDLAEEPNSTGLPPLRFESLDAASLLTTAAQRFRSAHPKRELTLDLAGELPVLRADPVMLRRLFDNLMTNADKYTESPGSPVVVRATWEGQELVVDVIDQGIGIAAADLPFVFRPFFRSDRSRTRSTGGLGLGLALAKRIAQAHGGTIEIESKSGEGTRVRVRIPGV